MSSKATSETRRQKARVRTLLAAGTPEYEIAEELDVKPSIARKLIEDVLADEIGGLTGDDPAATFARFKIATDGMLLDLDDVIAKGKEGKDRLGLNAVVAAVKAKFDITKNVIDRGQQLGILPAGPKVEGNVGGVPVSRVPTEELREGVDRKRDEVRSLVTRYAPAPYTSEEDGDIYQDEEEPEHDGTLTPDVIAALEDDEGTKPKTTPRRSRV